MLLKVMGCTNANSLFLATFTGFMICAIFTNGKN